MADNLLRFVAAYNKHGEIFPVLDWTGPPPKVWNLGPAYCHRCRRHLQKMEGLRVYTQSKVFGQYYDINLYWYPTIYWRCADTSECVTFNRYRERTLYNRGYGGDYDLEIDGPAGIFESMGIFEWGT